MEEKETIRGIVYCYSSPSGKRYIGQTTEKRWVARHREHKYGKNTSTIFGNAIKKYGYQAFTLQKLESDISTSVELNEREICWINRCNTIAPHGYNMTGGGLGHRGVSPSDETKRKMGNSKRGIARPLYVIEAMRRVNLGRKLSEEGKKKLSDAQKLIGNKPPVHRGAQHPRACPIRCIETGKVFETMAEASLSAGGSTKDRTIYQVACGDRDTAYGYNWEYVDPHKQRIASIRRENRHNTNQCYPGLKGSFNSNARVIVCIETSIIYETITAAAIACNSVKPYNIMGVLGGRQKTAYGFHWRYATEEEIAEYKSINIPPGATTSNPD